MGNLLKPIELVVHCDAEVAASTSPRPAVSSPDAVHLPQPLLNQVSRRRSPSGRGGHGRPLRAHRIPVRFSPEELAAVRGSAYATGRPLARFIREAALGHAPRTLRLQTHNDIVHALASALRQLEAAAARAPSAEPATAPARATLRDLLTRLVS